MNLRVGHIEQAPNQAHEKMLWDMFSASGPDYFVTVTGMMISEKHKHILETNWLSKFQSRFSDGDAIFQQDWAPCQI